MIYAKIVHYTHTHTQVQIYLAHLTIVYYETINDDNAHPI